MRDTYEINDRNEVIPYTSGRKCTDTRAWRDATDLELQQRDEIANLAQQSNQNRQLYETELKDHAFMRKTLERVIKDRDEARKLADELAETLSDLWHHYSLTGAAYEIIETALTKWGGTKEDMKELCRLCEFESGWGYPACRGCGKTFLENSQADRPQGLV